MFLFAKIYMMLALKICLGILLVVLYIIMMSIMIIFERDKPKYIILWSMAFTFLSVLGYVCYTVCKIVHFKKQRSLVTKDWEDGVYSNLVKESLSEVGIAADDNGLFQFNQMAYGSKLTTNNNIEIFPETDKFNSALIKDLQAASELIVLELTRVNAKTFNPIAQALIERAQQGVKIKFIYDKSLNLRLKKQLKKAGVKLHKFSKYHTLGNAFANQRNLITIDGRISYMANMDVRKRHLKASAELLNVYMRLTGEVVQEINLLTNKDATFAAGKFLPYCQTIESTKHKTTAQFVANNSSADLELLIIKAITTAKTSIALQLDEFIPTESIISLLRFAINSGIEVKLMVPIKLSRPSTYYATRAYAKQLALYGANVYLFDGFIRYNSIVVDDDYVIYGAFRLDRQHINTSLQSILIVEDEKIVGEFNKQFEQGVENSYRINNARYMLIKERFFKNFV